MKKIKILLFLFIVSLSFSDTYKENNLNEARKSTKIDLINSASRQELKNQIYVKNKIYKIYAKPLYATAINFREDEEIKEFLFGDQIYWSGVVSNGNQFSFQPKENAVSTSLFITTNRDKYYFEILSVNDEIYNPVINLIYPQDLALKQQRITEEENKNIKLNVANIEDLNQKYDWKKSYSWSPSSIVDDGQKTYIFLSLEDKDIPTFYIKKDGEMMISLTRINENINGQKVMVVDKVFSEGVLVLHKKQITIKNKNRR